jgi:hypothetical protein
MNADDSLGCRFLILEQKVARGTFRSFGTVKLLIKNFAIFSKLVFKIIPGLLRRMYVVDKNFVFSFGTRI